jgi:hypothetical protein
MEVLVDNQAFGRLVTVEPQPDHRHVAGLVTRRATDEKLVKVPIDWVGYVEAGRVQLVVNEQELSQLPEYVPDLVDVLATDPSQVEDSSDGLEH